MFSFSLSMIAAIAIILAVVLGWNGMRRLGLFAVAAAASVLLLLIADGTVTLPEIRDSIRNWGDRGAELIDDTGEIPVPIRSSGDRSSPDRLSPDRSIPDFSTRR